MSESKTQQELEEAGFEAVCALDEIPQMMPRRVDVGGQGVLLCRDEGEVKAVDEICPHKNKKMTYAVVHAGKIVCPHHMYEFDLDTGACNKRRCPPVETFEVEVVGDTVFVRNARVRR
ncbi:MAG: Rieske (2Fe-2S) protein [Myxococcota bacterium]